MGKVLNGMFWVSRFSFSASKTGRLLLRVSGAIIVALLLAGGGVFGAARQAKASGGGTCSATGPIGPFVHHATSANTFGSYTILDDSQAQPVAGCSGQYLAYVTPTWNPGGVGSGGFDNHPVGVWYDDSLQPMVGQWAIANEDGAAMTLGAAFNVYFAPLGPLSIQNDTAGVGYEEAFTSPTAEASIIDGYILALNLPSLWGVSLNGNPGAHLIVTQSFSFGNSRGGTRLGNPHQIGVWYDSAIGEWTIYNEDKSPIPVGATFNLLALQAPGIFPSSLTQTATSSNTVGDSTCINSWKTNGIPTAVVFVTHVYSGYFTDVPAVWYNSSQAKWCVFDGSFNNMPLGAQFTVLMF